MWNDCFLKPLLNKLGSLRAIFYLHLQYSLIHQTIIGHLGHGILSYLYCGILTVRKYSLWGKKISQEDNYKAC